jgi:DNA-binding NarL/FixJ family response regulator
MKKILILEDQPEAMERLQGVIASAFPDAVCKGITTLSQLKSTHLTASYDLALIDLNLPDGSGIEALRLLDEASPETLLIVITVMGDDAHIVAALSAGAQGYLLKEQGDRQLVRQLRELPDGLPALSPSVVRRMMNHFQRTAPNTADDGQLTEREKEILTWVARGMRNSEVAAELAIAESTVASHIKSIYRKLSISSRAEASWQAARLGL